VSFYAIGSGRSVYAIAASFAEKAFYTAPMKSREKWLRDCEAPSIVPALSGLGATSKCEQVSRAEQMALALAKTYMARATDVEPEWWLVDATDKVVGRLARDIAVILMGKHRPTYTPHVDTGDFIVVTNVEKIFFSGNKWETKKYTWYTGYPGLRSETAGKRRDRKPELILRDAVRRMLPKNKLATQMLAKLKIYVGESHPHQAQKPQLKELGIKAKS
jgi:large subunit ribosomal protein L13